MRSRRFLLLLVLALCAGLFVVAPGAGGEGPHLDVPYVPTPQPVVDAMLEVAGVAFDLGDWKAGKVLEIKGGHGNHTVYYWVVPPRKPGSSRAAR